MHNLSWYYIERQIIWQMFEMSGRTCITKVTPSCQTDHLTSSHKQQPHTKDSPTFANTIRSLQVNKSVTMCLLLYSVPTKEQIYLIQKNRWWAYFPNWAVFLYLFRRPNAFTTLKQSRKPLCYVSIAFSPTVDNVKYLRYTCTCRPTLITTLPITTCVLCIILYRPIWCDRLRDAYREYLNCLLIFGTFFRRMCSIC